MASGHLVDSQGNNVPIATIVAMQAGTILDCSESGSDAGAGERSSDGNDAWFACEVFGPGAVTVVISRATGELTGHEVLMRPPGVAPAGAWYCCGN